MVTTLSVIWVWRKIYTNIVSVNIKIKVLSQNNVMNDGSVLLEPTYSLFLCIFTSVDMETVLLFFLLQPFSLEQLSVWEQGGGLRVWLEGVEVCAAQFCALARQENHELTELLQNYWRCRRQLTQSHTQLHTQTSDCKSTQNRLWSFRDEQLTLQVRYKYILKNCNDHLLLHHLLIWAPSPQGVCADLSKVCGYHRFQQADFSESVLAELSRLFETRSELLHQKVALHAYTALLSRLQVESYLYRLLKGEWLINYTCLEIAITRMS